MGQEFLNAEFGGQPIVEKNKIVAVDIRDLRDIYNKAFSMNGLED